jgi:hypothetical protein
MFISNSKSRLSRIVGATAVALVISVSSFTAQADDLMVKDTFTMLEQNISKASQDLILSAKQEFVLSLKTQIAEQIFNSSFYPEDKAIASEATERSVTTVANKK